MAVILAQIEEQFAEYSHLSQFDMEDADGRYNFDRQYGFFRNIWGSHYYNIDKYDCVDDKLDKINKIVAMMKTRVSDMAIK
jgi:hypothetical protein